MPVDLSDFTFENVEEIIIAWLTPLRRTAAQRRTNDPLPFTLVTHIAGSENIDESTAELVVSVHTLCDKTLGMAAAAAECKKTSDRMRRLATHIDDVTLVDTRLVNVDYVNVVESETWQYYADTILQQVGRYAIGLTAVLA